MGSENVSKTENCYIVVSTIFGPSGPPPGRAKMVKKVTFGLPCKRRKSLLPENRQKSTFWDKNLGELLQKTVKFQKILKMGQK
jgi:hypothetical protein